VGCDAAVSGSDVERVEKTCCLILRVETWAQGDNIKRDHVKDVDRSDLVQDR